MTTAVPTKRCSKCHRDLHGEKRLKDAKGQYWCVDCGAPDAAAKTSGVMSPCPKCGKQTHAVNFVRKDGAYVCETCASGAKTKGGHAPASDEAAAQRKKLILACAMIAFGGASYVLLNYYWL